MLLSLKRTHVSSIGIAAVLITMIIILLAPSVVSAADDNSTSLTFSGNDVRNQGKTEPNCGDCPFLGVQPTIFKWIGYWSSAPEHGAQGSYETGSGTVLSATLLEYDQGIWQGDHWKADTFHDWFTPDWDYDCDVTWEYGYK